MRRVALALFAVLTFGCASHTEHVPEQAPENLRETVRVRVYHGGGHASYPLKVSNVGQLREALRSHSVHTVRIGYEIQGSDPGVETEWMDVSSLDQSHLDLLIKEEQGIMYFLESRQWVEHTG